MNAPYGVALPSEPATVSARVVHFTCALCGAVHAEPCEPPTFVSAGRPADWIQLTVWSSLGNVTETVCGECVAASPMLLRVLSLDVEDDGDG